VRQIRIRLRGRCFGNFAVSAVLCGWLLVRACAKIVRRDGIGTEMEALRGSIKMKDLEGLERSVAFDEDYVEVKVEKYTTPREPIELGARWVCPNTYETACLFLGMVRVRPQGDPQPISS